MRAFVSLPSCSYSCSCSHFSLLSPCLTGENTITLPPLMGLSLRKWIVLSVYILLPLFCSCEKHPVNQMPEVQREKGAPEKDGKSGAQEQSSEPMGTPAQFFPSPTATP